MSRFSFVSLILLALLGSSNCVLAQAVAVTLRLDTNTIPVGGVTTLRAYAQVTPDLRDNADRIFSWYVDVLNTNRAVAAAQYSAMKKTSSDNDPQISSIGFTDAANRLGIYDTFLNLPGAGVANPVELMAIPVTGLAPGQTRFQVRAGTGVPSLSSDFIVAPVGGDAELTGGTYLAANADLRVTSETCRIALQLVPLTSDNGPGQRFQLSFTPCPGRNHTIEYRDRLNDAAGWSPLAGAPHNSGSLIVTNLGSQRFYRVSATQAPVLGDLRLSIAPISSGPNQRILLTFPTTAGYNFNIEFRNDLLPATPWQTLPGGPYNSGSVTVTNTGPPRFFRLRANP